MCGFASSWTGYEEPIEKAFDREKQQSRKVVEYRNHPKYKGSPTQWTEMPADHTPRKGFQYRTVEYFEDM